MQTHSSARIQRSHSIRHTRARSTLVAGLSLSLLLAGCAGTNSGGGDIDPAVDEMLPITYASGAAVPLYAPGYLAETLGYFEDAGVDVTWIENSGPNTGNYIASGEADIAIWGYGIPLILAEQGKQTSIIMNSAGISASSDLVGAAGITSIEDLKGQSIATLSQGTAGYGAAAFYNDRFDLNAELVVFPDNGAIQSALASGQVAGATGVHTNLQPLVEEGLAVSLIDSTDPDQLAETFGEDYPIGGYWGLASTVAEKSEAMTRFVTAINRAVTYMKDSPPDEVAEQLHESEAFQTVPLDQLARLIESDASVMTDNGGYISEEAWESTLAGIAQWGIEGFDATSAEVSYDEIINMSILEASGITGDTP